MLPFLPSSWKWKITRNQEKLHLNHDCGRKSRLPEGKSHEFGRETSVLLGLFSPQQVELRFVKTSLGFPRFLYVFQSINSTCFGLPGGVITRMVRFQTFLGEMFLNLTLPETNKPKLPQKEAGSSSSPTDFQGQTCC